MPLLILGALVVYLWLSIRLIGGNYLVAEGRGPLEALKQSWYMTMGMGWRLFVILLIAILIQLAGVLALGIGILFTTPYAFCVQATLYNAIKTRRPPLPPPPPMETFALREQEDPTHEEANAPESTAI